MPDSFSPYEMAIKSVAAQIPGSPSREAIMTRLLLHIGGTLGEVFDANLKEHGLNYTSWTTLVVLYSQQGRNMLPSALSTVIHASRTHCSRIADDLVKKGLVERVPSELDRREVAMQLTADGAALVETLHPQRRKQYRELWSGFSVREMTDLEGLLRKLLQALDA